MLYVLMRLCVCVCVCCVFTTCSADNLQPHTLAGKRGHDSLQTARKPG